MPSVTGKQSQFKVVQQEVFDPVVRTTDTTSAATRSTLSVTAQTQPDPARPLPLPTVRERVQLDIAMREATTLIYTNAPTIARKPQRDEARAMAADCTQLAVTMVVGRACELDAAMPVAALFNLLRSGSRS